MINFLADKFGGRSDFPSAMKVAAYAPTAAWLASAFAALPILAVLTVLGLYSFYLFYLGLPILMRTAQDKTLGYLLVGDRLRDHRMGHHPASARAAVRDRVTGATAAP